MRLPVTGHCCKTTNLLRSLPQAGKPRSVPCSPVFAGLSVDRQLLSSQHRSHRSRKPAGVVSTSALTAASAIHLPPMLQPFLSPATLALTVLSAMAVAAWASIRRKSSPSQITADPTQFNKGVLSRCPTINSVYRPFPFLTNGHVETIFASKTRRSPPVLYKRESFSTPDGGTVHLDYHNLPNSIVGIAHCFQSQ